MAWTRRAGMVIAAALSLAALYTAKQGVFDPALMRGAAVALCALVTVLCRPLAARIETRSPVIRALCWAVDLAAVAAITLGVERFITTQWEAEIYLVDYSQADRLIAVAALIALVELTRRDFGAGLASVAALILIYCFFGESLPGFLGHAGFSLNQITEGLWYGYQGIFGTAVAVVVEMLFIYIVFGAALEATGAGDALIRIAYRAMGRIPGGAAHTAIVSSALFGSMSGSVTANVAGTGTFTIPMMKARGMAPAFAGGVEAAASTAGQFIPPVMGAAAFMLAQFTNTPYLLVCIAALIPALAFLAGLALAVYLEAKRLGVAPVAREDLPRLTRQDFLTSFSFLVPVLTVVAVLAAGRSPAMAGFWAVATAIVFGFINPDLRRNPTRILTALARGGVSGSQIMVAVGAIGIIVGGMNLTGLGLSFAQSVSGLGGESLFLGLLITALACIVLGMGMPTLPAYLIIILVLGPSLTALGAPLLAVHMFVLYFAVLSAITPPVALAAFAAAPIAQANPVSVALAALRLAAIGFVVPFLFVSNPSILIVVGFDGADFALGLLRIVTLIWLLSVGFAGYGLAPLSAVQRGLHLVAAALVLAKGTGFSGFGFALAAGLIALQILGRRTAASRAPAG